MKHKKLTMIVALVLVVALAAPDDIICIVIVCML